MKTWRHAIAGLAAAASAAWPRSSPAADSGMWAKPGGGLLNDAPVQVPSVIVLLTFAVLTLGAMLLTRAVAEHGSAHSRRRIRWLSRSEESRAT
jgi:hypothetical protein